LRASRTVGLSLRNVNASVRLGDNVTKLVNKRADSASVANMGAARLFAPGWETSLVPVSQPGAPIRD